MRAFSRADQKRLPAVGSQLRQYPVRALSDPDECDYEDLQAFLEAAYLVDRRVGRATWTRIWAEPDRVVDETGEEVAARWRRAGYRVDPVLDGWVQLEAQRHLRLVFHQANKLAGNGIRAEELFGSGWCGLLSALRNYRPSESAFTTYACRRILGGIQDGWRSEQHIPKRLAQLYRNLQSVTRTEREAELFLASLANYRDPALCRRWAREQLQAIHAATGQVALDANPGMLEQIPDRKPRPDDHVLAEERRAQVRAALEQLPSKTRRAVWLTCGEGRTLQETADELGCSTREVKTLRDSGLQQLEELIGPTLKP